MLLVEQNCGISVKITEIDRKNGFSGLLGAYQTARNVYYRLWNFLPYLIIALAGDVSDK